MASRTLRTAVLLATVVAVRAGAEDGPDLRALLSEAEHQAFTARIVGVAKRPGPVTRLGGKTDKELVNAVSYWLRVGSEHEARLGIRLDSLLDVVQLKIQNRDAFKDISTDVWANVALARAAGGDLRGGATMMEVGANLNFFDDDGPGMRSDAVALRIEESEAQDDVRTLLDILARMEFLFHAPARLPLPRGSVRPSPHAHFNKGLVLERLGLYEPAKQSYRRSMEQSDDEGWNEEAVRRIARLSQPSRRDLWLAARTRLEAMSRQGNVRGVRDVVRLFPDHARTAAEREFLVEWARGALAGSFGAAEHHLVVARSIGAALQDSFRDPLLADVVRVIDESIRRGDPRRIESLARAHLLYGQADAATTYDEAAHGFEVAKSPMANVARLSAILTRFDTVHIDQSLLQLRQLERGIPASLRVLRAMVDGAIGHCLAERGELSQALDVYARAQRVFETSGEPASVARMRSSVAHMLAIMGHPVEAWRVRRPALRLADASGDPALVELVHTQTASDELFNREEPRALALYASVLPLPPLYPSPLPDFRMNRWRNPAPLHAKQVMLDYLEGRPLRADVRNDLRFAQAISLCLRKPEQAEALLSESIAFVETTGRVAMLPYLYFYRAMARREAKRETDAIRDLTSAISLLEARRRSIAPHDLRDLWYRVVDDPVLELMNFYWLREDDSAAFHLGERRRALVFLDGVTTATEALDALTAEQISERLEHGTALIVFTASHQYTLVTLIESGRVAMHRLTEPTGHLLQSKRKLRTAIDEDRLPEIHSVGDELYELLIRPLKIDSVRIKRLVIAADQPLHDVPFAVFRDRESGHYLIEQFELVRVASASVYAQTKATVLPQHRTVVTVGDPAFDRNAYPSLPSLPAARAESAAIARDYPQSRVFVGRHATFQNFAATVSTADVIHIATHTAPSIEERQVLNLLFAPSHAHAGSCSVKDVAGLQLKKGSIVVVAGCQTGTSREPGTLRDFAGSFLASGARNVVATLWDIEDESSKTFARFFHRSLRRSGDAATATREAQLSMLRSSNPLLRNPRAWSGYQVYGAGS